MEPAERLAILETKLEQVEESNEKIIERLDRLFAFEARTKQAEDDRANILTQLKEMQSDLTRFKGFAGGMLFVASAVGAFLGVLKGWLIGHN